MARTTLRGEAWKLAGNVKFEPVPHVLLSVALIRGAEYADKDQFGSEWIPFDPWHKDDVVVFAMSRSYQSQTEGRKVYMTWHVGRRANTPAAEVRKITLGGVVDVALDGRSKTAGSLFRIPYHWRASAALLFGQEFETREALETAITGGAQIAKAA